MKAGFRREGVLRGFHRHRERPKDVAVFSLLRAEWTAPAIDATLNGEVPAAFRLA
jgi:RimJ/RimL family protein N-acetyltransferase